MGSEQEQKEEPETQGHRNGDANNREIDSQRERERVTGIRREMEGETEARIEGLRVTGSQIREIRQSDRNKEAGRDAETDGQRRES